MAAAAPAVAQTTTTTERSAAAAASAVRLTINLPQANRIQLDIDPVDGTVSSVTGTGPEAEALATLIRGNIAGNAQSFPGAEARLPEPKEGSGPTNALGNAVNGSPLGAFLNVGLLTASAAVTEDPNSTSTAQIASLGVGLPAQLGAVLKQVLDPLLAGIDQILAAAAPLDAATRAVCTGLQPVTVPVSGGVGAVPVLGAILKEVIDGTLSPEQGVLCNLRAFLVDLKAQLDLALDDLTGPGGVLGTGLIGARQTITTDGDKTTAQAEASIADLRVLGQNPFGRVGALKSTSTAVLDGATAEATVSTTAVQAFAVPLLTLETDLIEITGDIAGINLQGLNALLAQVRTLLDALAGIGVEGGPLDRPDNALAECPEALEGQLSGTLEVPGTCAAAAARGFGLAVTLPAALAGPLGITGPLVALQIAPTAAVVRGASTTSTSTAPVTPPVTPIGSLPRTGGEAPLAAVGVALLLGAALVRRRRSTAGSTASV
jgi:LPXTG-motif cell wall-anchored protein